MAEVFISYSSEDREHAAALAQELRNLGIDVWWDRELLSGDDFRDRISKLLSSVDATIVLWSRASAQSQWVMNEAAVARDRRSLVPVSIDGQQPPIDFRALHTIDMRSWLPGDALPEALQRALIERLGRQLTYHHQLATPRPIGRAAQHAVRAWYADFESALFYLVGQGFGCTLLNISCLAFAGPGGAGSVWPAEWPWWLPWAFALLNGAIVSALHMRPALVTHRMRVAVPLFILAVCLSIPAMFAAQLLVRLGDRTALAIVGPLTMAFLIITALASRTGGR